MEWDRTYKKELVKYIRKNLKKGYTTESLKWALVNQGYSKLEVDKAMRVVEQQLAQEAPVLNAKPVIKYEVIEPEEHSMKKVNFPKKPLWKRFFGL